MSLDQCSHIVLQRGMAFHRLRKCKNAACVIVDQKPFCRVHDPRKNLENEQTKERRRAESAPYKHALYIAGLRIKGRKKTAERPTDSCP